MKGKEMGVSATFTAEFHSSLTVVLRVSHVNKHEDRRENV